METKFFLLSIISALSSLQVLADRAVNETPHHDTWKITQRRQQSRDQSGSRADTANRLRYRSCVSAVGQAIRKVAMAFLIVQATPMRQL